MTSHTRAVIEDVLAFVFLVAWYVVMVTEVLALCAGAAVFVLGLQVQ